ncbi:heme exporter protein CcmB [Aurantivibrio infirmus]
MSASPVYASSDKQVSAEVGTSPSLSSAFAATVRRDLLIAYRHLGEMCNPLIFFLIAIALIPLGVTPDPDILSRLAPGMIWVMALLATLLSMDTLFRSDYDDGTLEQLLVSPQPLYLLVFGKVFIHWLTTGLPLTLLSPLLGMWLSLPAEGYLPLVLSLLIGTITLSMIGGIGAGLTVALRKGGVLISLIIMPMYIPVLIFGTGAVTNAIQGLPFGGLLAILGAFTALSMGLAPLATASAIKISING